MNIHYDTIEDIQNKKSHLLFSKSKVNVRNAYAQVQLSAMIFTNS